LEESERAVRADRAKEIIDSEVFKEAMERLRVEYTRISLEAPTVEFREEARKFVRLIDIIPNHFQAIILDGQLANVKMKAWSTDT